MPEIIHLKLDPYDRFEVGGQVLATLMRPLVDSHRRAPTAALASEYLSFADRIRAANEPGNETTKRILKKQYDPCERAMRRHAKPLRDRTTAGRMAVPILMEAKDGDAAQRAPGVTDNSIDQLARYVQPDSGMSDPHNIEARVWRPSLSVIHLCAAYAVTVFNWHRTGQPGPYDVAGLFSNEVFVVTLLYEAMLFEQLLAQSRLEIDPETLIRFRAAA